MGKLVIHGGLPLHGRIRVSGAKNAILPILAATILTQEPVSLHNCPQLRDVHNMLSILEKLGCKTNFVGDCIEIDPSHVTCWEMPEMLAKELRSSIFMLGPMVGRFRKAVFTYPGGCEIGLRPIDLHLKGLRALNVEIEEAHGFIYCRAENLKGAEIHLDYPSVGATENLMLAAVLAEGTTVLYNAAKEPEVVDLQNFVNHMGGKIAGAGTGTIIIEGVTGLTAVTHRIMPDRIVAGTYMAAAAITGGDVYLEDIVPEHILSLSTKLREMGCLVEQGISDLHIRAPQRLRTTFLTETSPYPGFPTDMQAQMLAVLTVAEGTSIIIENIFENRFKHVPELIRMGANIMVKDRMAIIRGVDMLSATHVQARDLRGGAALTLAGLAASGQTIVEGTQFIDRGYDHLEEAFAALGADIVRTEEETLYGGYQEGYY